MAWLWVMFAIDGTVYGSATTTVTAVLARTFWPSAGSTESTVPSASSERWVVMVTLSSPSAASAASASARAMPVIAGTWRAVATWMTTSPPSCMRPPLPGSIRRTTPSVSSDLTWVARTAKPLDWSVLVASACVMPMTSGTTLPPQSSIW